MRVSTSEQPRDGHDGHGQWTVITSQFGPLRCKRIICGREGECTVWYERSNPASERINAS
jgi:hypothetical protein